MDIHSEDLLVENNNGRRWARGNSSKPSLCQVPVTIDILPDNVLLETFAFYVGEISYHSIDGWQTLVHVCRKWRIVVFGSPCRLNLRLQYGTARKSSRKTLDIWPSLPILLWPDDNLPWNMDHIMAALKHNDRVCEINLWDVSSSQLGKALAAMQEPFPELTSLVLRQIKIKSQVIPNSFLGGYAPRLRDLTLYDIAFPGLPKLLPSATHLVRLDLFGIPRSGYISPQAVVTCLSTLTRLERLCLIFDSPQSRPHRESRRPHPLTCSVLPALTDFVFSGVREYLDDFVTRIDAPMLHILSITYFHQLIFDTPNLPQFISRTPRLKAHNEACVVISDSGVRLASMRLFARGFQVELEVPYSEPDWPSVFAQACRSSSARSFISSLENLYIRERKLAWDDYTENAQWLELLQPFTAVKSLYLCKKLTPRIASVLQELVGGVVEILPALQGLFLEEVNSAGPVQEAIGQFVAARQLSSHPIAVSHWAKRQDEWLGEDD